MSYIRLPLALAAICALVPAAPASGQGHNPLNPESPAGVEYQLPLEQARKNAGGAAKTPGGKRGAEGSGPAPLFGAGIVRARATSGAAGDGKAGEDEIAYAGGHRSGARAGEKRKGSEKDDRSVARSAVAATDSDGGSATLRTALIAFAVLLVGALLGLLLRRGLRHPAE